MDISLILRQKTTIENTKFAGSEKFCLEGLDKLDTGAIIIM